MISNSSLLTFVALLTMSRPVDKACDRALAATKARDTF